MNQLILSVDGVVIEKAREAARNRGRSLDDLVRGFLEALAHEASPASELDRLRELSARADGRRRAERLDRDALHGRR
jgi:hypothetical protein